MTFQTPSGGANLSLPHLVVLALIIIASLFAWWSYRRPWPPVSGWVRWSLTTLRSLSIALILLFIVRLEFDLVTTERRKPVVAVLVDRSASMGLVQGGIDRDSLVSKLVRSDAMTDLIQRAQVKWYAFSDSLIGAGKNWGEIIDVPPIGVGTNYPRTWENLFESETEPVAAIIMITDGGHNSGPAPERAALRSPTPIFAIGIGSTLPSRDLMLTEIRTNPVVYQGNLVPVEISYRCIRSKDLTLKLRILNPNEKILATRDIVPSSDFYEGSVQLNISADEVGRRRLIAEISPIDGELSLDNNRRSFFLNVLAGRMKALVMAGPPDNNLGDLIRRLNRDDQVEVILRTTRGTGFYEGDWPDRTMLAKMDMIFFHHFPVRTTELKALEQLVESVKELNLPVAFFDGGQIDREKLSLLADLLPVKVTEGTHKLMRDLVIPLQHHAVIADPEAGDWNTQWSGLPPLLFEVGGFKPMAGAQIAAVFGSTVRDERYPAVVASETGSQRSIAVLPRDLWRWGLISPQESPPLETLLARIVRWLAVRKVDKRVKVSIPREIYSSQEKVDFTAQVVDASLNPIDGAMVTADIELSDTVGGKITMEPAGQGRYIAAFHPWAEGEYNISVTAEFDGVKIGSDAGKVAVEPFNIELLTTPLNEGLLTAVTRNSGGAYAPYYSADSLIGTINPEPNTITRHRKVEPWDKPAMLLLIIGLLTVEWFIRVRVGML